MINIFLIQGLSQVIHSNNHHSAEPGICYCVASFSCGGKKTNDVCLTWRCHRSNIIPASIFYYSMWWGIGDNLECFFCFCCCFLFDCCCCWFYLFCFVLFLFLKRGDNRCFPQHRRNEVSVIIIKLLSCENFLLMSVNCFCICAYLCLKYLFVLLLFCFLSWNLRFFLQYVLH